jgi:hypothetical protein
VNSVLHDTWGLSKSHTLLIEFNNDILYEASEDMDDEDEQEMYQRRLKKNLSELKIRDLSIL